MISWNEHAAHLDEDQHVVGGAPAGRAARAGGVLSIQPRISRAMRSATCRGALCVCTWALRAASSSGSISSSTSWIGGHRVTMPPASARAVSCRQSVLQHALGAGRLRRTPRSTASSTFGQRAEAVVQRDRRRRRNSTRARRERAPAARLSTNTSRVGALEREDRLLLVADRRTACAAGRRRCRRRRTRRSASGSPPIAAGWCPGPRRRGCG